MTPDTSSCPELLWPNRVMFIVPTSAVPETVSLIVPVSFADGRRAAATGTAARVTVGLVGVLSAQAAMKVTTATTGREEKRERWNILPPVRRSLGRRTTSRAQNTFVDAAIGIPQMKVSLDKRQRAQQFFVIGMRSG